MSAPILCVINGAEELGRWREAGDHDGRIVITWNSQVLGVCAAAGIPCLDAMEMVGPETMDRVYATVIRIAQEWWRPQLEGLFHRGMDLARAMGRDMLYAFIDGLASRECTRLALDMVRPKALEVVDCGRRAFFWDPPGGPYPGVANAVAVQEGICRGLPSRLVLVQPAWPLPAPRRGGRPGPLPGFDGRDGTGLLFFFSGVDYGRLRLLLKPIVEGPTQTFLVRSGDFKAPEAGPAQLSWYDWLSHFPPDPELQIRVHRAVTALARPETPFQQSAACLFSNPYLDFQWNAFASHLVLGGRIMDATEHVLSRLQPDACVIGTATAGTWRAFTATARMLGIPVASVHHSAMLPESLLCGIWRHDADLLLIEGRLTRAMYERWGWDAASLVEIGSPLVRRSEPPRTGGGPILVLPNEWDWGFAVPAFDNRKKTQSLTAFARMMRRRPEWSFVLKPHPMSLGRHREDYQRAAALAPNLRIADPSDSIVDHLADASVTVFVDSCSQAFVDACMSGLPVIHHRPSVLDARCTLSLQDLGYVPVTKTVGKLEEELDAVMNNAERRREVIDGARRFIRDFSSATHSEQVAKNMIRSLARLAQDKGKSVCCS